MGTRNRKRPEKSSDDNENGHTPTQEKDGYKRREIIEAFPTTPRKSTVSKDNFLNPVQRFPTELP